MKKNLLCLLIVLFAFSTFNAFADQSITVTLHESDHVTAIDGAHVSYWHNGNWRTDGLSNGGVTVSGTVTGTVPDDVTTVRMNYKYTYGTTTLVSGTATFNTVKVTAKLLASDGTTPLQNGSASYYAYGNWRSIGTTDVSGETSIEILPGSYTLRMGYKWTSEETASPVNFTSGGEYTFTTTKAEARLETCGGDPLSGGSATYYANGNWRPMVESSTGVFTQEILTGNTSTYTLRMGYKYQSNEKSHDVTSGPCIFKTTNVTFNFSGNVKYYAYGNWRSFTKPSMEMLPGNYDFYFEDKHQNIAISGCSYGGNVFIFRTKKADGTALPGINISRNDYGNHYVPVGITDADGSLLTLDQPDGAWKFKANKNYSNQYITSGPALITFQTSKFVAHVKHTDGSDFEGIETEYNDYGSHWIDMSPQFTGTDGTASIELFPGNFKFRAKKNYSAQTKSLELTNSGLTGVVEFQTSTFVTHVKHTDGSDFEGIETEYNDYGSHWIDLSPKYTGADGKASIELFPGNFTFRAKKNYSLQESSLEITSSGTSDITVFQTAMAVGFVRDCDNDSPVSGIEIEYNDYGSHWIDLSPRYTGEDGKASIELFPGTFDLQAKTIYTSEMKPITLPGSGTTTQVEFNPTRVCFNYPGTVKYNDYGSHWLTIGCDTYMFPGTYDFRFYNGSTIDYQSSISVSGCTLKKSLIFVQLKNSEGTGLPNCSFDYRFGWGSYTTIGTDDSGNGIWYFIDGNPTKTKVKVSYLGASVEKEQNIQVNPKFIFNTVKVTADLKDSGGNQLTAENWQYRYGWGSYSPLNNAGAELLPVKTKIKVSYKGASVEKEQNVGSNAHYDFNTVSVTADLKDSEGNPLTAESWQYRYGWGSYSTLDNTGEELLPVKVKVKVEYKGASVEKEQNVGSNAHYGFNTVSVTADLKNSEGSLLTADSWQYRYGWGSYSTLDNTGEELLPVKVKVKVGYKGASVEKEQNVGSNAHYGFNTVSVTADLKNSEGYLLTADSWQYRYGWGSYSSLDNDGEELLPVKVKVKVEYKGASVEKEQNVGSNAHYDFNTVSVTADLKDSEGNLLTADKWEYRYGWGSYSLLNNEGEELLPVKVKVRVSYNSTTDEKEQNVGTNPDYTFTWDGANLKDAKINNEIASVVEHFSLKAYPNPFTDRLKFEFATPDDVDGLFNIYDINGRLVKTIFNGTVKGGVLYNIEFVPTPPISNIYFYRMTLGDKVYTGKVLHN